MEGAAPVLAAAIILPLLLGGMGLIFLRKQRWVAILSISATAAVVVLVAGFALG